MDFKPKTPDLTVICEACWKKQAPAGNSEASGEYCDCASEKIALLDPQAPNAQTDQTDQTAQPVKTTQAVKTAQAEPAEIAQIEQYAEKKTGNRQSVPTASESLVKDNELCEELGVGSLTTAYKARHRDIPGLFLVKVLRKEFAENPRTAKRFKLESERARNLNHANVAAIYDAGTTSSGLPYIVTDYLEGQNIEEYLKKEGFFSEHEALEIFLQICDGLIDAHKKGLIHRDLKPTNMILKELPNNNHLVKIADFGIAKVLPNPGRETKYLTPDGEAFGDARFMSPEQIMGQRLDARSDIYSLGCVMYQCLSGNAPFTSSSPVRLAMKQIKDQPQSVMTRFVDLEISPGMDRIIMRTLEKHPDDRYQSVEELRKDLLLVKRGKMPALQIKPNRNEEPPAVSPQNTQHNSFLENFKKTVQTPFKIGSKSGFAGSNSKSTRHNPIVKKGLIIFLYLMVAAFLALFNLLNNFLLEGGPHRSEEPFKSLPVHVDHESSATRDHAYSSLDDALSSSDLVGLNPHPKITIESTNGFALFTAINSSTAREAAEEALKAGISLNNAQFKNKWLKRSNFQSAELRNAEFINCNLEKSILNHADLTGAEFIDVNLSDTDFADARLSHTLFIRSNLTDSNLTQAKIGMDVLASDVDLTGIDLSNVTLVGKSDGVSFTGVICYKSDKAAIAHGKKFAERFKEASGRTQLFEIRSTTGALLYSAKALSYANAVTIAVRKGVDLSGADMRLANLTGSNLNSAQLSKADLRGANLTGVTWKKSNLTGARLDSNSTGSATGEAASAADS